MRFLFRLDLSLHADAGKKFGILVFATKHGLHTTCWHKRLFILTSPPEPDMDPIDDMRIAFHSQHSHRNTMVGTMRQRFHEINWSCMQLVGCNNNYNTKTFAAIHSIPNSRRYWPIDL